jgi:indole-3-glycerol phosphate synthase
MPSDILVTTIVQQKENEISRARSSRFAEGSDGGTGPGAIGFPAPIRNSRVGRVLQASNIIAEIKRASPSKGDISVGSGCGQNG